MRNATVAAVTDHFYLPQITHSFLADQYQDLFRDRTLGTQILSEWCTIVCRNYMQKMLAPTLKKLTALKKPLEVRNATFILLSLFICFNACCEQADPRVMVANLDDNRAKLRELAEELINSVILTSQQCPPELRNLLSYMSRRLKERFDAERARVMTVFLFSRVIIPPLLNPTPFGIVKDPWTPEAGRTGILLAKVVGNLSSGVSFEEHNPLQVFNDFLNLYREKVQNFLEELIAPSPEGEVPPPDASVSAEVASNAFKCIHYFLYWSKDAIVAYRNQDSVKAAVTPAVARLFFDLLGIVEDIELAEGKPDAVEISMLDLENPSSSAHASGKRSPTKIMAKPTALPRPRPERASSAAPPPISSASATIGDSGSSASAGPQMVRRISEKWNRQLQLDAVRQKQEREAAEKRALSRLNKPSSSGSINGGNTSDNATREASDPSLTLSTDSADKEPPRPKEAKRAGSATPAPKPTGLKPPSNAQGSVSAPVSPAAKGPKRKLAPSLTTIGGGGTKKSSRSTVSFGTDSPVSASTEEDSSSDSRDSSSPSRRPSKSQPKTGTDKPSAGGSKVSVRAPATTATTLTTSALPTPVVSAAQTAKSPRAESSAAIVPLSPRGVDKAEAPPIVEPVAPSEKNLESMSILIKSLGVENAQLSKQNKDLLARVDQLQVEIGRLQQEVADAHSTDAKIRAYMIRLGQAIKSRKQTDSRVRQAQVKSLYGMYHSVDDSQFDFGKASSSERREWVMQVVGHRSNGSTSAADSISRRLSTATALLKSLPQVVEVTQRYEMNASDDKLNSSRSEGTPRDGEADAPRPTPAPVEFPPEPALVDQPPSVPADPSATDKDAKRAKDKKPAKPRSTKPGHSSSERPKEAGAEAKTARPEKPPSKEDKPEKSEKTEKTDKGDKPEKGDQSLSGRRGRSESKRNASLRKGKVRSPEEPVDS